MFLTKDLFFILVWKYSSSCLFFFVESISKFISNLSLLSLFDFRLMIIYKPSKLVFLPIIRFGSKIIWIYLRICPYSIYTWHAWLSKGPFSRIWFLSHIYLFFWVLENYVEGLKLWRVLAEAAHRPLTPKAVMHFFFWRASIFFLVKVNVRVRVRVSIRVRMRVRVSIRVRMRVRNGQFLNWSITALGVKGLWAASASKPQWPLDRLNSKIGLFFFSFLSRHCFLSFLLSLAFLPSLDFI